jgi:protein ImuA
LHGHGELNILYKKTVFKASLPPTALTTCLSMPPTLSSPNAGSPRVEPASSYLQTRSGEVLPTGNSTLDNLLPGGGWPRAALVELLQSGRDQWAPTQAVCSLLVPALTQLQAQPTPHGNQSFVAWVGTLGQPTWAQSLELFGPALSAQGVNTQRLLWIKHQADSAKAWAALELLRCTDVAGVVLALGHAEAAMLRRLQYSAAQHNKYMWVLRAAHAASQASPAALRLQWGAMGWEPLHHAPSATLHIHKRAGTSTHAVAHCPQLGAAMAQALHATTTMRRLRRLSETPLDRHSEATNGGFHNGVDDVRHATDTPTQMPTQMPEQTPATAPHSSHALPSHTAQRLAA